MSKTERGKLFDKLEPEMTPKEIENAKDSNKVVVSFRSMPFLFTVNDIGFLAVKFAFVDGSFETVFLDQFSARLLHGAIQNLNELDWKTEKLRPGPQVH
jgi:hypothetical protein